MPATKSGRPKAGLGLSSAIGRDQLTARSVTSKSSKPPPVKSRDAKRAPKPKPRGKP